MQLSYAKAAQEGLRMAIVCDGYTEVQFSKENFAKVKRAFGWSPWRGVHPQGQYLRGQRGAIVVYHDKETQNWLSSNVSPLTVWEGSRPKMAGLETLPVYKRVVDWFPGSAEDTERYFQRLRTLNQG